MSKRVAAVAWPSPGNSGHDVKLWNADGISDVRLVLAEETPQYRCEPDLQPPPCPFVLWPYL
jgi:hypothetical protein